MSFLEKLTDQQIELISEVLYHHDLPQRCLCKRALPWSEFLHFYVINLKDNPELSLNNDFFDKFEEYMDEQRSLFIPEDVAEIFVKYYQSKKKINKDLIINLEFIKSFEIYFQENYSKIKKLNKQIWKNLIEFIETENEDFILTTKYLMQKFNNYLKKLTKFNPINTLCCRGTLINPPPEVIRKFRESLIAQEIEQTVDKKMEEIEDAEDDLMREKLRTKYGDSYKEKTHYYVRKIDEPSKETSGFVARIIPTGTRCYSGVGHRVTSDDEIRRETQLFFDRLREKSTGQPDSSNKATMVRVGTVSGNITPSGSTNKRPAGLGRPSGKPRGFN